MSNIIWILSKFLFAIFVCVSFFFCNNVQCHITEIILNEDTPPALATRSGSNIDSMALDDNNEPTCNIELSVVKSYPGRCVRLGKSGSRGCVSNTHIIPFHPGCLF